KKELLIAEIEELRRIRQDLSHDVGSISQQVKDSSELLLKKLYPAVSNIVKIAELIESNNEKITELIGILSEFSTILNSINSRTELISILDREIEDRRRKIELLACREGSLRGENI
ncbi:MAG: hypothetical protein NZ992_02435, partial [Candidatus Korarchaeum sp.]|nr:hypothetical protein [Candidatus Korarchaeum sp.]MDW8036052.1 hypothetical protein [Candidatus Korarchaeum sp.]